MLAVTFDLGSLTVTGKAVRVIQGVRRSIPGQFNSATQLAVSETGTLIYLPGPPTPASALFISVSPAFDDGPTAAATGGVRVVLNWFEELKRLVPRN